MWRNAYITILAIGANQPCDITCCGTARGRRPCSKSYNKTTFFLKNGYINHVLYIFSKIMENLVIFQNNVNLTDCFISTLRQKYIYYTCIIVTFRVCFVYIVLFLALLSYCVPFCSTSRSVFIGWLDCQSSFWHHDVCQSAGMPAVFEDASWLCVGAPCQRTLCSNAVSSLCLTPIVYRCLIYFVLCVMLCVVRCDLFIDLVLWLLTCIEFFVEDNADARIGVSVLLCQVQS